MKPLKSSGLMPMFIYQFVDYSKPNNPAIQEMVQETSSVIAANVYELVERFDEEFDFDNEFREAVGAYEALGYLDQLPWWGAVIDMKHELDFKRLSTDDLLSSLVGFCIAMFWSCSKEGNDIEKDVVLDSARGVLWTYLQIDSSFERFSDFLEICATTSLRTGIPRKYVSEFIDSIAEFEK